MYNKRRKCLENTSIVFCGMLHVIFFITFYCIFNENAWQYICVCVSVCFNVKREHFVFSPSTKPLFSSCTGTHIFYQQGLECEVERLTQVFTYNLLRKAQ